MTEGKSLGEHWEDQQRRWDQYQQPKWLWLWAAIGSALATTAIGFTLGGWTTQAAAGRMAGEAASAARTELVANACAINFAQGYDYEARLSALKQAGELKRTAILRKEGWVTLAGMEGPLPAAAVLCAEKLADTPPSGANAMAKPAGSSG